MKRRIKIRFHLGAGENFKKWRIENIDTGDVDFIDPNDYSLRLENCKLYNQRGSADKIYSGDNKTVCSWIMASKCAIIIPCEINIPGELVVAYNPRIKPYWRDDKGNNIDKKEFSILETIGRMLYINKK
jgi:hypothetical protein